MSTSTNKGKNDDNITNNSTRHSIFHAHPNIKNRIIWRLAHETAVIVVLSCCCWWCATIVFIRRMWILLSLIRNDVIQNEHNSCYPSVTHTHTFRLNCSIFIRLGKCFYWGAVDLHHSRIEIIATILVIQVNVSKYHNQLGLRMSWSLLLVCMFGSVYWVLRFVKIQITTNTFASHWKELTEISENEFCDWIPSMHCNWFFLLSSTISL